LTEKVQHDMPRSSKEKVDAVVFKLLYEHEHGQGVPIDPELTLKPDLKKTLVTYKQRKCHHNGVFGPNKFSKKDCWSCCMNTDKDSEGCVV